MNKPIDAKTFGLHPGTSIEQVSEGKYSLIIRRKSRIVMKDGRNILQKVSKIKASVPDARVDVQTTAPVCSKTQRFLRENGVNIFTIP